MALLVRYQTLVASLQGDAALPEGSPGTNGVTVTGPRRRPDGTGPPIGQLKAWFVDMSYDRRVFTLGVAQCSYLAAKTELSDASGDERGLWALQIRESKSATEFGL